MRIPDGNQYEMKSKSGLIDPNYWNEKNNDTSLGPLPVQLGLFFGTSHFTLYIDEL